MKLYKYIIIGLFSIPYLLFSQENQKNKSNDVGGIEYVFKIPTEKTIYKTAFLVFNDSISNFIYNKIGMESSRKTGIDSDGSSININFNVSDEKGAIVHRNFKSKEIRTRIATIRKLFDSYYYDDNWIEIEWEIKGKTKK